MTWQGEDDDDDEHDDDEDDDEEGGRNGDDSDGAENGGRRSLHHHRSRRFKGPKRTVDFAYDPDVDTPDEVASEIGSEFELSPTDKDMCLAAFKELLDSMSLPFEDRE